MRSSWRRFSLSWLRADRGALEEARALIRLIEEFGLTHQQAAEAVGRSRAAVSNLLRLTELADEPWYPVGRLDGSQVTQVGGKVR